MQNVRERILRQLTFEPFLEGCICRKVELEEPKFVTAMMCEHAHLWMKTTYENDGQVYNEEACLATYN